MLIKEYRICLPMTVEEYRIAQLYMIQKKSREESSGAGSGVEIQVNTPYTDGPGGAGQYTMKIYHIGSHLPGWFRAILPKSALIVEEEAWNAYPYTKTIYRCPFIEKFTIEIETVYHNDDGSQDNVFKLSRDDLRSRIVDYMDIVTDPVTGSDYHLEEDPRLFKSEKTARGPLGENWREEYTKMVKESGGGVAGGTALMCAYKLCRVEFRYWGMQGKIERFIHDVALRKTMVRAHRQAWCWQDEYFGLTMEDIRRLERETQEALKEKMAHCEDGADPDSCLSTPPTESTNHLTTERISPSTAARQINFVGIQEDDSVKRPQRVASAISMSSAESRRLSYQSTRSRMADSTLERLQTSSSEEDEFFDANDEGLEFTAKPRLNDRLCKSSSVELIEQLDDESKTDDHPQSSLDQRLTQYQRLQCHSIDASMPNTPRLMSESGRSASVLFLLLHGGSVLDMSQHDQLPSKQADVSTFVATLDTICQSHYPSLSGQIAVRLVTCPNICNEALSVLASLTPYHSDVTAAFNLDAALISENFPLSSVALFATQSPEYCNLVAQVVQRANSVYASFLQSTEGIGFSGQVFLISDSIGSMIGYDILSRSGLSCHPNGDSRGTLVDSHPSASAADPSSSSFSADERLSNESTSSTVTTGLFDFEVSDFFMLGSPMGLVLAYRRLLDRSNNAALARPACNQMYNICYSSHPSAARMEPLLHPGFRHIAPVKIPRFQKFPYGDASPIYMVETALSSKELMTYDGERSSFSSHSTMNSVSSSGGSLDSAAVSRQWWGVKRIDYAVYCPEALRHFPMAALPHLLHASIWESTDIIAFILRQMVRQECRASERDDASGMLSPFRQEQPREKWLRRRTTIKLRNVAPNHRANDIILLEGKPQTLAARFMYGPLDVVSLSGEKIDIHIMMNPPVGKWTYIDTAVTDANGRVSYTIPADKQLSEGMYPVKMVVRGDHTWVDSYLCIIQPKTDAVVFSIDGSFTASVSIMGKDPKVRPGAVDVVRHWHELGYLVLYVTARPDMQQRKVVTWLAQHNFPHGMVAFMDGLSAEPLRQKTNYLKQLVTEAQLSVVAAYGSSKDIPVYQAIGLQPNQIYIVGKVAKKHRKDAIVIADGYTAHLNVLTASDQIRPPVGNVRLSMRKGCYGFPVNAHLCGGNGKNPVRKTTSLPQHTSSTSSSRQSPALARPMIAVSEAGNTVVTTGLNQNPL